MTEKIELIVVPFQSNRSLLLPRSLVEFVLPYARPLPSDYRHKALVGAIIYDNDKVPVVDVRKLYVNDKQAEEAVFGQRRLVMLSCISEHSGFSSYALIANNAPRLLEVSEEALEEVETDLPAPFHSCVRFQQFPNHQFLVVDLESLEKNIFE